MRRPGPAGRQLPARRALRPRGAGSELGDAHDREQLVKHADARRVGHRHPGRHGSDRTRRRDRTRRTCRTRGRDRTRRTAWSDRTRGHDRLPQHGRGEGAVHAGVRAGTFSTAARSERAVRHPARGPGRAHRIVARARVTRRSSANSLVGFPAAATRSPSSAVRPARPNGAAARLLGQIDKRSGSAAGVRRSPTSTQAALDT